ncbi:peptidyl-prolyl cis-trans isomerase A (cyclophilin A)/peptidyl-prolyl cis-trans isomerase B (cyclophilin B) [Methylobacillus rhizosphaerae]|uniref:Peptidyl-prolyl cis-trans isomerase n=1 Tax=Methylobacillus rhizosphaerae TaxID=551994 RepID=A0A239APC7_9PROT|nr:peptidylprolyl isomerase [Methylobacillus rhizosphaerae]SNR97515.1 peptidyl-prolyl cis-trans isomerase A (cyclophilin A)/peptidyl-prolyl cis-trans isomerase B (cyclophilin B) [Methylobacillus rhizosphaerae]
MLSRLLRLPALLIVLLGASSAIAQPLAEIQTNQGLIVVDLNSEKAPNTVANFVRYAKEGHYAGTIFHRVIAGFMIQGGGLDSNLEPKPTHEPIRNEADNGLTNATGTIAMARTGDPHSASDQFFINVANNTPLNFSERSETGWGYTVFGRVIQGMDVVQRISLMPTDGGDVPYQNITIEAVTIKE